MVPVSEEGARVVDDGVVLWPSTAVWEAYYGQNTTFSNQKVQ